ncbi:metal ABC transporter substrate-binding protein [Leucobacter sp. CX169]|uniref:metal ABC transporter substrate-binding protein n=2 Tax=unclassified Leucobacter TaxID=2621730 RepID=UPI00165E55DC|nr:metal ABC transporter substrate-binding protein [Leucobacter sp. CX169]MBC9926529.1 metal ABC transporter substrate-binding protein [Leucobacter sp. cx-169]
MVDAMRQRAWWSAATATAALLLSACAPSPAGTPTATPGDDRPVVLATFTVLADLASEVAGPHLRVESLTRAGAEIHGYEPTPADVARASEADLILDNGLGLEAWFAQFVRDSGAPHAVLSAGIEPIAIAGGEAAGHINPHAWMSPENAEHYVENIVDAFSELDPAHAADYRANGDAYRAKIESVFSDAQGRIDALPATDRTLVTCEGAFSYLARDLGLSEHYLWPVNAEQQITARRMAAVIDAVRAQDVPAVFCESTVSDRAMRQLADDTGAAFGGTLYVDSLSAPDGPVPDYLSLLRVNLDTIATGLSTNRTASPSEGTAP